MCICRKLLRYPKTDKSFAGDSKARQCTSKKTESIQFTKSAEIPHRTNTVQKTLFKIPPPEYIDANHKIIRTGIRHTLENNQLALNLDPNSSYHFPLWVDPTLVRNEAAKGVIDGNPAGFVGDFNGDGFDDVFTSENGNLVIYFGETLPSAGPSDPDVVISNSGVPNFSGQFRSAGDFNGDSFDDLIFGDSDDPSNGQDAGRAYIILGRNPISQLNIDLNTQADIIINGSNPGDKLGFSVDALGNFDGVGPDDIVVAAKEAIRPGINPVSRTGTIYVFRGENLTTPTTWDAETDADLIIRLGEPVDEDFIELKSVGDFNGDGKRMNLE